MGRTAEQQSAWERIMGDAATVATQQATTTTTTTIGQEEADHAIAADTGRNVRCVCGAEYSRTANLMRHISQWAAS